MQEAGFSEDEANSYGQLEGLDITPEQEIKPWSAEAASLNPWISVRGWLNSPAQLENKDRSKEAYWIGSDAMVRFMPEILFKNIELNRAVPQELVLP